MTRYADQLKTTISKLMLRQPGLAAIAAPPGEARVIAAALKNAFPECRSSVLSKHLFLDPGIAIAEGLPVDSTTAIDVLHDLNSRREWIATTGRILLLILHRDELRLLERHAADIASALLFVDEVRFVPDPSVRWEDARASLRSWYDKKFGRLDLRGFARIEAEDVSFRVEDVYQAARAIGAASSDVPHESTLEGMWDNISHPLLEHLAEIHASPTTNLGVILGHPGSGKSFFLRWLALQSLVSPNTLGITAPIPLLASFSDLAQFPAQIGLKDFFVEMLLKANQPAAHLIERGSREGRVIFLLDGLDEVGNETGRKEFATAARELATQSRKCLVCITSRLVGYTAIPETQPLLLSPFDDHSLANFLVRWCELYECSRSGDSAEARQVGRHVGIRLAREVRKNTKVRSLATSPLMATVLAIVHRTGLRLPDHRVELYAHITRILVERWNHIRSPSARPDSSPIRVADAVRLLGPVALRLVESGIRGAVREDALIASFDDVLKDSPIGDFASGIEIVRIFRDSLGLFIEHGPGLYSFLHLTLAEYLSAREILRTRELERLGDTGRAFESRWHEVVLLALGEARLMQADDERVSSIIGTLVSAARHQSPVLSPLVPVLLAAILAEDIGLRSTDLHSLANELVPHWWFNKMSEKNHSNSLYAHTIRTAERLRGTHAGRIVSTRLQATLAQQETINTGTYLFLFSDSVFHKLQVDIGELVLSRWAAGDKRELSYQCSFVIKDGSVTGVRFAIPRSITKTESFKVLFDLSTGWINPRGANLDPFRKAMHAAALKIVDSESDAYAVAEILIHPHLDQSSVRDVTMFAYIKPRLADDSPHSV